MTKVGYTTLHPNLTPFVAKVIRLLDGDLWMVLAGYGNLALKGEEGQEQGQEAETRSGRRQSEMASGAKSWSFGW